MTLNEILINSGGIIIIALTIIQITPLKINPWSNIAKGVGRLINAEIMDKLDENEANNSRYRIIRFDDEIRHSRKHTVEHFNQIMTDINEYEKYCRTHPNYKNRKAEFAIKNIEKVYQECWKENSFLI